VETWRPAEGTQLKNGDVTCFLFTQKVRVDDFDGEAVAYLVLILEQHFAERKNSISQNDR